MQHSLSVSRKIIKTDAANNMTGRNDIMKILIVSDTHKQNQNLSKVLDRIGHIDMLIHLGDSEGSEDYICAIAGCPVEIVGGNNDFFSNLDREKELKIGKYNVLITHGHYYYVSMGTEDIKKEAEARGKDIVMFGHTHKPLIEIDDNVIAINPGSISYPRQEGRKPSYVIMDIDDKGEAHFTVKYL